MFTHKCFIKKNTPKIVKQLEKLGYGIRQFGCIDIFHDKPCLLTDTNGGIYGLYGCEEGCIYCGTNEELFLAMAALRDDSDYMQWFTNDVFWLRCEQIGLKHEIDNNYEEFCVVDFHKATVYELIEHFKK